MGQTVLKKKWPGKYIIDLYDVYTIYTKGKYSEIPVWRPFYWLFRLEALRVKRYEKKILRLFDHILVTCQENMHTINYLVRKSSTYEVPNGVNFPEKLTRSTESGTILMVGNFEYSGNKEGILWFYNEVWKRILHEFNNAKLILVGKCPEDLKTIFSNDEQIEITGVVSRLRPSGAADNPR